MENEESLKTGAVVGKFADAVKDEINNLLANGVVTTGVVVGSILLAIDDLLGVVELTVSSVANFIADGRLEIDVDSTGDVLASSSLAEEGVEGIIAHSNGLVGGHGAIRLNSVLEAVKLPAVVTNLDTSLAQVDRDTFYNRAKQATVSDSTVLL